MHDDLIRWRDELPILARKTYLASCSVGAMPSGARARLGEFLDQWAEQGAAAWDGWLALGAEVAELVARALGAPAGTVTMHHNVSALCEVLASCYDFRSRRRKIVMTDQELPSAAHVWLEQRRRGAVVELVATEGDPAAATERLLDAIDEKTALVPVSHVLIRTSAVSDVEAVVSKAHAVGARVCLHGCQAAGCMPVDVASLGVDICMGDMARWLCGGPGSAWLYVRDDLIPKMRPAACGWLSHARPFDFEIGAIDFAPGIERFRGGEPPVPALHAAHIGCEMILEVGPERIRERSAHLTSRIIERAQALGIEVRSPLQAELRGGTVCLDLDGARECRSWLSRRDVLVGWLPGGGLRLSPHFYSTEEECDLALDAIEEYRGAGRHGSP